MWKDQTRLQSWYNRTESIALRAQLGEISSEETSEVNRVLGGSGLDSVTFTLSNSEPALLKAFNTLPLALLTCAGFGCAGYAKFVKKYNNLWLLGAILPSALYLITSAGRNGDRIDNAYR